MFTGIIQKMGRVKQINNQGESYKLTVTVDDFLDTVSIGDSIATNGVCLTVTRKSNNEFTADVMPTTYRKSTFSDLNIGSLVNLEKSMRITDGFDGHIVTGHIDSIGKITKIKQDYNAILIRIEPPQETLKYFIPEGSVAIDGISLTIAELRDKDFTVSIIPHTREWTTLKEKTVGSSVNIEGDVLGKYVERLMQFNNKESSKKSSISKNFLKDNGFM
ncbi:MAG TPA: riboflavin synthase [Clostridia bacterium]|nr:riboflavin synthase [Clostridia bacterium]